jgi:hypothetical protein
MMATPTRYETSKAVPESGTGRKALLVAEVALGIIIASALFATVERNLIPISAQAAPKDMQSAPTVTPGWGAADPATATAFPAETWYTPAQYQNQATETEPLPSQF